MTDKFVEGTLVEIPTSDLGLGKVLKITSEYVYVFFKNQNKKEASCFKPDNDKLITASVQSDPVLDNLPPYDLQPNGRPIFPGKLERWTIRRMIDEFRAKFPLNFNDPAYLEDKGERKDKWAAHEMFVSSLGGGQGQKLLCESNISELTRRIVAVFTKAKMFASYDKVPFTDALQNNQAAERFFTALFALLDSPVISKGIYQPYIDSVLDLPQEGKSKVATWPVVTLLPFIAQPDRHMFLKPTHTQLAAEALTFNLHYESQPNWRTYEALLEMGRIYADEIKELRPRDLIDVQSFLWLAGHE